MDPFLTPMIILAIANASSNIFNGDKTRKQSKELALNNEIYQKHQQKIQETQLKLNYLQHRENQVFQAQQAELNREHQTKLERFRQEVQEKLAERNFEFQAWRLQQEQTLQQELAHFTRETQEMVAQYQRETAWKVPEVNKLYETWPLRIVPSQILNDSQSDGFTQLKVIIAPPEVDYDKFGAKPTGASKLEKSLAEGLRQFFNQYYPKKNRKASVEFLDGAWDSKRFHGGASMKALFSMLKSEPMLIMESEIDGDNLNIRFAYWGGGESDYTYESVLSKFNYRDMFYESAKQRALKWKKVHDILIEQGRNPASINELDTYNLKVLQDDEQLSQFMDISTLTPRYKLHAEDFERLNHFLIEQHCMIGGMMTDIHHLLHHETIPQLFSWIRIITEDKKDILVFVLKAYQQIFDEIAKERAFWMADVALELSYELGNLEDKSFGLNMLNNSLRYWLLAHYLQSYETLDENLELVQKSILSSDFEYIQKVKTALSSLKESEKASKLYEILSLKKEQLQLALKRKEEEEQERERIRNEIRKEIEKEEERKKQELQRLRYEEAKRQKIIDENTVTIDGLMYQNQPFSQQDKENYDNQVEGGRVWTWDGAKKYAKNLRLGGYDDWRLPTIDELKKLLTSSKNKNSKGQEYYIRKGFVENLEGSAEFWSITENNNYSSSAWYIYFNDGFDYWDDKSNDCYALCVRGQ
jgi:hypothetical protein